MLAINRSLSLLAIAFLMVFSSCKKDEEAAPAPVAPTVFAFSFTANGTNYTCTEANVDAEVLPNPFGGNLLGLTGTTSTGEAVTITCDPNVGTYSIGGMLSFNTISFSANQDEKICTSGSIKVNFNNTTSKRVSGTFSGSGSGITISNGVFSYIKY